MCSGCPDIPLTFSYLTLATKVNFNLLTPLSHSVSSVAADSVKYLSCRSGLKTESSAELHEKVPSVSVREREFFNGPGGY